MAIGGMHPVGHKKHWYIPAKDERFPAGAVFTVTGDSVDLWIQDYNVRVATCATVLEQPLRTDKKVLVCLDDIDGDCNVNVFINKLAQKEHNRLPDGIDDVLQNAENRALNGQRGNNCKDIEL